MNRLLWHIAWLPGFASGHMAATATSVIAKSVSESVATPRVAPAIARFLSPKPIESSGEVYLTQNVKITLGCYDRLCSLSQKAEPAK